LARRRSASSPYELPQYLSFFVLGTVAYRGNWLRTLPGAKGKVGLVVAPLVTLVLFPLALSHGAGSGSAGFTGLGDWHSAVYALWESALAVGMGLGLVALFRRFLDRPGWLGRFTARNAYTVYIIHLPIVALLVVALRGLPLGALLKSGLVAIVVVPLCFALAYLVRKLPLASRIL
jgi:glucans biosynthesis protein C